MARFEIGTSGRRMRGAFEHDGGDDDGDEYQLPGDEERLENSDGMCSLRAGASSWRSRRFELGPPPLPGLAGEAKTGILNRCESRSHSSNIVPLSEAGGRCNCLALRRRVERRSSRRPSPSSSPGSVLAIVMTNAPSTISAKAFTTPRGPLGTSKNSGFPLPLLLLRRVLSDASPSTLDE